MPFSITLAQEADIRTLAQISDQSCDLDPHTQLKRRFGGYNHVEVMTGALNQWLARPPDRCRVIKALDDESREILGWAAWGMRGYEKAEQPIQMTTTSDNGMREKSAMSSKKGIARLEELTSSDLKRWMGIFMPDGVKCLFIHSIVVKHEHQGKGVGLALMRNGTSQADRDGVFCWVHSSEAGYDAFTKAGFDVVGKLEIDLDEFAMEAEQLQMTGLEGEGELRGMPPSEKYGKCTFRYMKRLPSAS